MKPFVTLVGYRHFSSGSGNRLTSFISGLAITGLVLGITLLVVVVSVMNGFDREMEARILSAIPHIRLLSQDPEADWREVEATIRRHDQVQVVAAFNKAQGMLTVRGEAYPVIVEGQRLAEVGNAFAAGFIPQGQRENRGLFITSGIAGKLGVEAGDRVTLLLAPEGSFGFHRAPRARTFEVAGVFSTHTELDHSLVVGDLELVADAIGLNNPVQGLQLKIADIFAARSTGYELLRMLPMGFSFTDWLQSHGNLYHAIKMSRNLVSLLVFLIIAIAVFNVVSMLVMTVLDKRAAIAILKTLGATRLEVLGIVITQGALIGIIGTGVGLLLGAVVALNATEIAGWLETVLGRQFFDTEVYPIDYLPVQLVWSDLLWIGSIGIALNLIATLYPAWNAANTQPAEVLRYE